MTKRKKMEDEKEIGQLVSWCFKPREGEEEEEEKEEEEKKGKGKRGGREEGMGKRSSKREWDLKIFFFFY